MYNKSDKYYYLSLVTKYFFNLLGIASINRYAISLSDLSRLFIKVDNIEYQFLNSDASVSILMIQQMEKVISPIVCGKIITSLLS